MRIKKISITGLFGMFDHEIPLNMDERVTIIHGPNGIGKTIILSMLNNLFINKIDDIKIIPFNTFTIYFEDDSILNIDKQNIGILKTTDDFIKFKVYFIQTQRLSAKIQKIPKPLLTRPRLFDSTILSVLSLSEHLLNLIKTKLADSTALSQSLDSSFLTRLSNEDNHSDFTISEIENKLNNLENKRLHLIEAGILNKDELGNVPIKIDEKILNVYSVNIRDREAKLNLFDDLYYKISLFKKIVNSHLLDKKMSISKNDGLIFTSDIGSIIPIDKLSSGEQHLIVLFYEFLFKVEPDALILIDEPELSLHVGWQVKFLKDLLEVVNLVGFDVLIATHSPQIINDRWDLTVQLNRKVN